MQQIAIIAAFAATCLALPSGPTQYQYYINGTLLPTPDVFSPIKLNGIPIGTEELHPSSVNGTVHLLTDGHHFGHEDWVLSGRNGLSWEYRPDLKHHQAKRQSGAQGSYTYVASDGIQRSVTFTADDTGFIAHASNYASTQTSLQWEYSNESSTRFILELAGSAVETVTDILEGDLTNIFFNALEIFA
ncbi:hypothetical protein GGI42DRAFT_151337 [Trichoderma sp. SZMC 28013]